ncbi:MAG TPA: hypothetical protein VK461_06005, partial [Acidimicrobiales bacterium]|nr:hypothetical protein [Acidimicrobiales bacterium]
LALGAARARGAHRIIVVAGDGGRLDHLLAGLLALTDPHLAAVEIEAWIGDAWARPLHGPGRAALRGRADEVVTLVAIGGEAQGVRTAGLLYPLRGETLFPSSTRGVSNVFEETEAEVWLDEGTLLIIRPEALA